MLIIQLAYFVFDTKLIVALCLDSILQSFQAHFLYKQGFGTKDGDHSILNEVDGLEKPTSENIDKWLWSKLIKKIPNLDSIEINRPRIGGCIFNGD